MPNLPPNLFPYQREMFDALVKDGTVMVSMWPKRCGKTMLMQLHKANEVYNLDIDVSYEAQIRRMTRSSSVDELKAIGLERLKGMHHFEAPNLSPETRAVMDLMDEAKNEIYRATGIVSGLDMGKGVSRVMKSAMEAFEGETARTTSSD